MTLTPQLSTNGAVYNFGMAETYSYVDVLNDQGRPLFAKATYLVNPNDISVVLSASNINVDLDSVNSRLATIQTKLDQQLGQNGFVFSDSSSGQVNGTFTTIQIVSATKFLGLTATNSSVSGLTGYELPQSFVFNGPVTNYRIAYGAVLAYKA